MRKYENRFIVQLISEGVKISNLETFKSIEVGIEKINLRKKNKKLL